MANQKYILDTNIITYLYELNSPFHKAVVKKLREVSTDGEVFVSVLTFFEISFGEALAGNARTKMTFEKLRKAIKRDFHVIAVKKSLHRILAS